MFTDTLNKVSQGCITHTTLRMIPVIEFTVNCLFQLLDFNFLMIFEKKQKINVCKFLYRLFQVVRIILKTTTQFKLVSGTCLMK
jgi:hypothetical protein